MDHVQIKMIIINLKMKKKIEYFSIHMYTHQAQQQNTFHGKS
jgi:hypothetical protein